MENMSSIFKGKVPEVRKMNEQEVVDQVDKNLDINFKIYGRTFSKEPKSVFDVESRTKATVLMSGTSSSYSPLDKSSGDYIKNIIGSGTGSGKEMNVTEYIGGTGKKEKTSFNVQQMIGTSGVSVNNEFNTTNKINSMLGTFGGSKRKFGMPKLDAKSRNIVLGYKSQKPNQKLNSMLGLNNSGTQAAIYRMIGTNNSRNSINRILGKSVYRDVYGKNKEEIVWDDDGEATPLTVEEARAYADTLRKKEQEEKQKKEQEKTPLQKNLKSIGEGFERFIGNEAALDNEIMTLKTLYTPEELAQIRLSFVGTSRDKQDNIIPVPETEMRLDDKKEYLAHLRAGAGPRIVAKKAEAFKLVASGSGKKKGSVSPLAVAALASNNYLYGDFLKPKESPLSQSLRAVKSGLGVLGGSPENIVMSSGLRNNPENIVLAARTSDTPWEQRVRGSVGTVGTGRALDMYNLQPSRGSTIYQYIKPSTGSEFYKYVGGSTQRSYEDQLLEKNRQDLERQKQLDDLAYLRQLKEAQQAMRQENQYKYQPTVVNVPATSYEETSPSVGEQKIKSPQSGRLVTYTRGPYNKHN